MLSRLFLMTRRFYFGGAELCTELLPPVVLKGSVQNGGVHQDQGAKVIRSRATITKSKMRTVIAFGFTAAVFTKRGALLRLHRDGICMVFFPRRTTWLI
jgi:hypothetical protein